MYFMFYICLHAGPPALVAVNITKNNESLSIVVQWDAVDDSLPTTYTVTWADDRDFDDVATVEEDTSYTITGLTLDTVYTITVTAANKCGDGSEVRASVLFSTGTTSISIKFIVLLSLLLQILMWLLLLATVAINPVITLFQVHS